MPVCYSPRRYSETLTPCNNWQMNPKRTFQDLVEMMARLRAPDGCPWDREQTLATLGPMLIEEAYEVIEAAEAEDWNELRDELGDLLFQIIFYGQIAAEAGHFDVEQSITRVHEKMTRRHPHVFGEETVESTADVLVNWEAINCNGWRKTLRDCRAALRLSSMLIYLCGPSIQSGVGEQRTAHKLSHI